VTDNEKMKMVN